MWTIWIFGICLFLLTLFLVVKIYEHKKNKKTFVSGLFSRFDSLVISGRERGEKLFLEVNEKTTFFVSERLPDHSKNFWSKGVDFLKGQYKKVVLDDRGTRVLNGNGTNSNFLKAISKEKNGNGRRRKKDRIDDDSLTNSSLSSL